MSNDVEWALCEEFTVVQAALLAAGLTIDSAQHHIEKLEPRNRLRPYEPFKAAIKAALAKKLISGSIVPEYLEGVDGSLTAIPGSIDVHRSTVDADSLKSWLATKGVYPPLFESEPNCPAYLNPEHPRYSPELAAAINTWVALKEPFLPKTAEAEALKSLKEEDVRQDSTGQYSVSGTQSPSLTKQSQYWKDLEARAEQVLLEYPAWRDTQRQVRKTGNLLIWLTETINVDSREVEILKKVLSDIYP